MTRTLKEWWESAISARSTSRHLLLHRFTLGEWPVRPWGRIHIDFAGPFLDKMFLVVVDVHSKWLEVVPFPNITSQTTISTLRSIFATHGLPEMLVSDNGPSFKSAEFQGFLKCNGIHHFMIAPYHPASNDLAERAVQTFKSGLKLTTEGALLTIWPGSCFSTI